MTVGLRSWRGTLRPRRWRPHRRPGSRRGGRAGDGGVYARRGVDTRRGIAPGVDGSRTPVRRACSRFPTTGSRFRTARRSPACACSSRRRRCRATPAASRSRPRPYDAADGFSPGSAIVVHVPGLDNPAAMSKTGAVGYRTWRCVRQAGADRRDDQATGRRQLIWAELDANATSPATTDLLIRPGKNFIEGHTYIVALRNLRTASGTVIQSRSGSDGYGPAGGSARSCVRSRTGTRRSSGRRKAAMKLNDTLLRGVEFTVASPQSETGGCSRSATARSRNSATRTCPT